MFSDKTANTLKSNLLLAYLGHAVLMGASVSVWLCNIVNRPTLMYFCL